MEDLIDHSLQINADLLLSCFGSFCIEKCVQDGMMCVDKE